MPATLDKKTDFFRIPTFEEIRLKRPQLQAKLRLITSLGRIISGGLTLSGGGYAVRLQPMMDAICANLATALAAAPDSKITDEDAHHEAQAAYEQAFQEIATRMRINGGTPFAIYGSQEAEAAIYRETFESSAGVEKAWRVARYNADRAKSRLLSLYVLGSLLSQGSSRTEPLPSDEAYSKASQHLWVQVNRFEHHALLFAAMLGGDNLADTLKSVMDSRFSEDHSVIEYLYPDGKIPGSWHTAEEKQFRANLQAYKNSLE